MIVLAVSPAPEGARWHLRKLNGKWQALDGSMSGTTPLRVFIKDGVRRRSPQTSGQSGLWLSRTRYLS